MATPRKDERGRSAITGRFTTVAKARRLSRTHVVTRVKRTKK